MDIGKIILIIKRLIGRVIAKFIIKGFLWGLPVKENLISNGFDLSLAKYYHDFAYYPYHKDGVKFAKVLNRSEDELTTRDIFGKAWREEKDRIIKRIDFEDIPNDVQFYFILECGYDNYNVDNLDKELQDKIIQEKI